MQPFKIFNPEVKNKATKIFGGQASGLCDWDDVKYPVMLQINEGMFSNLWSLAKVSLKSDRIDYQENLTKREKETFNQIVYSLRELNEVMDRFNFYIGFLSSDPSIQQNAQLISTFNGLHDNVYRLFQNHFSIDGQNNHSSYRFAAQPLEEFIQLSGQRILKPEAEWSKEELQGLLQGLIHYAIISGIVFQGAFVYFQALAAKGKMIGVNNGFMLRR